MMAGTNQSATLCSEGCGFTSTESEAVYREWLMDLVTVRSHSYSWIRANKLKPATLLGTQT